MDKSNKTLKRYAMVYEPNVNWSKFQYIVNIGKCKLSKYHPYRFIEFNKNEPFKGITNYREYLCDIDRFVNKFENIDELKNALGISSCYSLYYNVSSNKYYSRIVPVFQNEEIDRLLNVTVNDKIVDNKMIEEMFLYLTQDNNLFLDFFLKSNVYKTSVIKRSLIEYKRLTSYVKKTGYNSLEISEAIAEEKNIIKEELKKYPTARSIMLARFYYNQSNLKNESTKKEQSTKSDAYQYKLPGF